MRPLPYPQTTVSHLLMLLEALCKATQEAKQPVDWLAIRDALVDKDSLPFRRSALTNFIVSSFPLMVEMGFAEFAPNTQDFVQATPKAFQWLDYQHGDAQDGYEAFREAFSDLWFAHVPLGASEEEALTNLAEAYGEVWESLDEDTQERLKTAGFLLGDLGLVGAESAPASEAATPEASADIYDKEAAAAPPPPPSLPDFFEEELQARFSSPAAPPLTHAADDFTHQTVYPPHSDVEEDAPTQANDPTVSDDLSSYGENDDAAAYSGTGRAIAHDEAESGQDWDAEAQPLHSHDEDTPQNRGWATDDGHQQNNLPTHDEPRPQAADYPRVSTDRDMREVETRNEAAPLAAPPPPVQDDSDAASYEDAASPGFVPRQRSGRLSGRGGRGSRQPGEQGSGNDTLSKLANISDADLQTPPAPPSPPPSEAQSAPSSGAGRSGGSRFGRQGRGTDEQADEAPRPNRGERIRSGGLAESRESERGAASARDQKRQELRSRGEERQEGKQDQPSGAGGRVRRIIPPPAEERDSEPPRRPTTGSRNTRGGAGNPLDRVRRTGGQAPSDERGSFRRGAGESLRPRGPRAAGGSSNQPVQIVGQSHQPEGLVVAVNIDGVVVQVIIPHEQANKLNLEQLHDEAARLAKQILAELQQKDEDEDRYED